MLFLSYFITEVPPDAEYAPRGSSTKHSIPVSDDQTSRGAGRCALRVFRAANASVLQRADSVS